MFYPRSGIFLEEYVRMLHRMEANRGAIETIHIDGDKQTTDKGYRSDETRRLSTQRGFHDREIESGSGGTL